MSDVQVLKPDKDFSKEVDKQIPEAEQLAQVLTRSSPIGFKANVCRQMSQVRSRSSRRWRSKPDKCAFFNLTPTVC